MSSGRNKFIEFEERSNPGLIEEHNHDYTGTFDTINGSVLVVCGGIKTKAGAAIASKIAVKSIGDYFTNKKFKNLQKALYNAILYANQQIFEQAQKNDKLKGMGTTIAVALISNNEFYYAFAGNSRLYLLKGAKLQLLTKDHVIDDKLVNILGISRDLKFSICKNPLILNDNDQILLTSDGISSQLTDDEIYKALSEEDISIAHKTAKLIDRANAKGGKDNASAIFARYDSKMPVKEEIKIRKKVNPLLIYIPLVVIVVGIGIYFLISSHIPQHFYHYLKNKVFSKEIIVDSTQMQLADTVAIMDSTLLNDSILSSDYVLHDTIINYKVKRDENLYRIALHFNLPVEYLAKQNNVDPKSISEGQEIKIPIKGIYHIEEGDLIYQIASKLKVDYKSIIDANKLDTFEYLVAGNELYIPYQKDEYAKSLNKE